VSEAPKPSDDAGQSKPVGPKEGKRFTPEQQAVIELARQAERRGGVTAAEALVLEQLAKEAGVPFRGPEVHPNRPHGRKPHIHLGPVDHLPIK